jgi:hypothetical protein
VGCATIKDNNMIRDQALTRDGYECKMCLQPAEAIAYLVRPQLGGRLELGNVLSMCRRCLDRQAAPLRSSTLGYGGAGTVEAIEPRAAVCDGRGRAGNPSLPARGAPAGTADFGGYESGHFSFQPRAFVGRLCQG